MFEQLDLPVGVAGLVWIVFVGGFLPWSVWKNTRRAAQSALPDRASYMMSAIVQLAILAGLGLVVAQLEQVELFPAFELRATHLVAGLAALAVFVAVNWKRWEHKVRSGERRVQLISPRTPREIGLWTGVSACAGIGEEILYRALLPTLAWRITDSVPVAITVSVVAFGLGHLHQGWSGVLVTAFFAAIAHALVGFTETLVIAMAVHFAYDLIAGLRYASLAKRLDYRPADA
jgi:membrane protease YdiL (CAAX protease family)